MTHDALRITEGGAPQSATWETEDAFPVKPDGQDYGYRRWGRSVPCSREALIARFAWWRLFYPALVWAPETPRLVPPVECPPLVEAVRAIRLIRFGALVFLSLITTGLFAYIVVRSPYALKLPVRFFAALVGPMVVLGPVPLVWTVRRFLAISRASPDQVKVIGGNARFFAWCRTKRSSATWLILGSLTVVWVGQWIFGVTRSLSAAGSDRGSIANGEFWRILTANFLHMNFSHFIGNLLGIAVCAWFIERLANRSLLLILIVASGLGSELASLVESGYQVSAGASGIASGLSGFLLALSLLYRKSMPTGMWKFLLWLVAIEVMSAATQWDRHSHAAHLGGFAVGAALGGFSAAKAPLRFERMAGRIAAVLIIAAAVGTVAATALKHEGAWGLARRAYRAGNRGNHEEAIKLYSQILAKDPKNGDAYLGRAAARWNLDDLEGARSDYDAWLQFAPDNFDALVGRGSLRREMGDLDGALGDLDRILRWDSKNPRVLAERAHVLLLKGDLDAAMRNAESAVNLAWIDFGEVLASGPPRDVQDLADRVRANTYALYVRGRIRVAQRDFDGAIADFTESLRNNSDTDYRQTARGEALWLKGETDAALVDFEATLRKYENDPDARLGRGRIRAEKRDTAGARADFEAALKSAHRWWRHRAEAEAALKSLPSSP